MELALADLARVMQTQLGAGFLVMHSLPWVFPARDDLAAPAREGEADFLILHRQYGLLIIEVKGGEITLKGRSFGRRRKSCFCRDREKMLDSRGAAKNPKKMIERTAAPSVAA